MPATGKTSVRGDALRYCDKQLGDVRCSEITLLTPRNKHAPGVASGSGTPPLKESQLHRASGLSRSLQGWIGFEGDEGHCQVCLGGSGFESLPCPF